MMSVTLTHSGVASLFSQSSLPEQPHLCVDAPWVDHSVASDAATMPRGAHSRGWALLHRQGFFPPGPRQRSPGQP